MKVSDYTLAQRAILGKANGAGEGNRTLVIITNFRALMAQA